MKQQLRDYSADQRGITGLETAIALIAFVVVASVFAFTVLSAGIFSSEKGKEAVYAGLKTTRSTIKLVGPIVVKDTDNDDTVDEVIFMMTNAAAGEDINVTTTVDSNSDGLLSDEDNPLHTTVISVITASQSTDDVAWTRVGVGKNDGDVLLEDGEVTEITVDVSNVTPGIGASAEFIIEIRPRVGASVVIERTIPPTVDKVMDLR